MRKNYHKPGKNRTCPGLAKGLIRVRSLRVHDKKNKGSAFVMDSGARREEGVFLQSTYRRAPPALDSISRQLRNQSLQPNRSETIDDIIVDARRVASHRVTSCSEETSARAIETGQLCGHAQTYVCMGGKSSAGDTRFIVLAWRQARRARACEIKSKVRTVVKFARIGTSTSYGCPSLFLF